MYITSKKKIKICLGILFIPLVIFLLSFFILFCISPTNFTKLFEYVGLFKDGDIFIDIDDFPSIKDYFYYVIYTIQAMVTGILSYYVWKTAEKNTDLTVLMTNKEENNRQKENTLIVYYDLLLGINDLEKLYLSMQSNPSDLKPKRLFFSNEWIKNIAMIKDILSGEELKTTYLLYGNLLTIKDYLENKIIEEYNMVSFNGQYDPRKEYTYDPDIYECIKDVFNNVIDIDIWSYKRMDSCNPESIIDYLQPTYSSILTKLKDKVEKIKTN